MLSHNGAFGEGLVADLVACDRLTNTVRVSTGSGRQKRHNHEVCCRWQDRHSELDLGIGGEVEASREICRVWAVSHSGLTALQVFCAVGYAALRRVVPVVVRLWTLPTTMDPAHFVMLSVRHIA